MPQSLELSHNADLYFSGNPYEKENLIMGEHYAALVLEYAKDASRFLELGIGFGRTVALLSHHFSELSVMDAEPRLIAEFKNRHPSVTFIEKFFQEYQTDQRFGGIGIGFVLDLVDDPLAMLQRYSGFLVPGGQLYVCIENAASLHRQIAHIAGLLPNLRKMSEFNAAYGHRCFNTHDDWLSLFENAKLKVVASHGLYLKPFSTRQLDALALDESVYMALSRISRNMPEIANACFYVLEP